MLRRVFFRPPYKKGGSIGLFVGINNKDGSRFAYWSKFQYRWIVFEYGDIPF